MGRRAKNKQSAPEPLDPKPTPSSKKLGKRKADSDDLDGKQSQRPSKKVKDGQGNPKAKTKGTSKPTKGSKKKGKYIASDGQDSGDGWEDVDDDVDLKAHVKFVVLVIFLRFIAQQAARSLFDDGDEEDPDAHLDLDEFDLDNVECDLLLFMPLALHELILPPSDEPLRGQLQEFDFDTDEEEEEEDDSPKAPVGKRKKSKQAERPLKIIPTASDASSSDSDASDDDDEERVTMANMEARSKALDAHAAAEAELDAEELRGGAQENEEDEDVDMDREADEEGNMDAEPFHLPTTAEREEEKARGGPDLQVVQRRMRECVRVLEKFSKRAEKGRSVIWCSCGVVLSLILVSVHGQNIQASLWLI
jgi:ribosomal RNA methyltransferase Nop2